MSDERVAIYTDIYCLNSVIGVKLPYLLLGNILNCTCAVHLAELSLVYNVLGSSFSGHVGGYVFSTWADIHTSSRNAQRITLPHRCPVL